MNTPYNAAAVANWFLARAERDGVSLDPIKLQKLIYFADGWCLALTDKPLIDEHIEAWDYGPVVPSIYHEFKDFGRNAITRRATAFEPRPGKIAGFATFLNSKIVEPEIRDDPDTEQLLERIWRVYGKFSGVQLANMTHAPDSAWHKARATTPDGRKGTDIQDALIREEFVGKIARGRAASSPN